LDYSAISSEDNSKLSEKLAKVIQTAVAASSVDLIMTPQREPGKVELAAGSSVKTWSPSSWPARGIVPDHSTAVFSLVQMPASTEFIVESSLKAPTFKDRIRDIVPEALGGANAKPIWGEIEILGEVAMVSQKAVDETTADTAATPRPSPSPVTNPSPISDSTEHTAPTLFPPISGSTVDTAPTQMPAGPTIPVTVLEPTVAPGNTAGAPLLSGEGSSPLSFLDEYVDANTASTLHKVWPLLLLGICVGCIICGVIVRGCVKSRYDQLDEDESEEYTGH